MAPPKRIADKGKAPATSKLLVHKPKKLPPANYGSFLNASCHANYTHYFLRRPIAVERSVHKKTLFDTLIGYKLGPSGWESLMTIKGEV